MSAHYSKVEETEDGRFCPVLKIKHCGCIDLGTYTSARHAAVAFDVARLIYVHQMRPDVDLRVDIGLMHPADGYLVDPAFRQLLDSRQSFEDVASLLRSGVLVDTFLCAKESRQTRSNTSGERPAGRAGALQHSGQRSGSGAGAPRGCPEPAAGEQKEAQPGAKAAPRRTSPQAPPAVQQAKTQQRAGPKSSDDTQHALPLSPFEAAADVAARAGPAAPARGNGGGTQSLAASPCGSPTTATHTQAPACGAADSSAAVGGPSATPAAKRKPMRWVEYPMRGGGQFVSCISERAMKANMTLPAKMKAEIFQVSEAQAQIKAYDLMPGSTERWEWEVKDYVGKPGDAPSRSATYITNLGPFFRHNDAAPGDVMVVVASAPGAVKATVWKCHSPDALEFKAHLAQKAEKADKGEKPGRQAGGSGGKKRAAEGAAERQGTAKAAKPAAGAKAAAAAAASRGGPAPAAARPPQAGVNAKAETSFSPAGSRQLSKTGSGMMRAPPTPLEQQAQPDAPPVPPAAVRPSSQQQQQHGAGAAQAPGLPRPSPPRLRVGATPHALLAMAESGVDASAADTMASPTGQVAQSPFRQAPLQSVPFAAFAIKQEQQEQQEAASQREPGQHDQRGPAAAGAQPAVAGGATASGANHSPARMSCADVSALLGGGGGAGGGSSLPARQQQALSQPAASGAGGMGLSSESHLPDPLVLANDEGGVYVAMATLLRNIAGTGHVPVESVNSYRRSFGRLEPHGKRWWHYDSLKQLVDAAEWADVQEWLLCK